ncbi:hypothetical protein A3C87_00625 [Candidatus Kaiserbacteria bacterium RIFCSPHIGHO2_02_FULL_49_34]|uniref:DUF4276 family protein n=1 Tax=Candidatus Kaiserbacteria bacterium RIFCSPHIGHO2_02_FULL_49_34 TaxID=1798491 RepID=A0A1F6DKG9_9BACT|nr:MAG: hypothetical protein A3C87_00625 [Candidatus Kaiserbacteria bacterium RIFCSPHIGHO2_02_FULL_49_34]
MIKNPIVILFILEDATTREFVKSLLISHYGFTDAGSKNEYFLIKSTSSDSYAVIGHPGSNSSGGWNEMEKSRIYRKARLLLNSKISMYGLASHQAEVILISDRDSLSEGDIEKRKQAFLNACNSAFADINQSVHIAKQEVESWFLAGSTFEEDCFDASKDVELTRLRALQDTDEIPDPKGVLDEILTAEYCGQRIGQGQLFGGQINIELACSKSPSFKIFIEHINNLCVDNSEE